MLQRLRHVPAQRGDRVHLAPNRLRQRTRIRQRCIELYMSGMKLEDSRRFGRPGPNDAGAERSRNFYPYPTVERDNNSNTPADPPI